MFIYGYINRLTVALLILTGIHVDGQKSQCEVIAARVSMENQNTIVNSTYKRLVGTWLSEGCEIRPGPEYVLRSYSFKADGMYRVIQHRYWDDSCSNPKFSIISNGVLRLKKDTSLNINSAIGFIKRINITVIPHDTRATKELDLLVASECPDEAWKPWRRHEEHLVFQNTDDLNTKPYYFNSLNYPLVFQPSNKQNSLSPQQIPQRSGNINCLASLKWAFNELKLIKIQLRPIMENNLDFIIKNVRYELLVGDVHSRLEQREHYTPTAFQTPLLKYLKDDTDLLEINNKNYTIKNACNICQSLFSSDKSPPHLLEKPHLPPYIWGDWISMRCEIRPMGLYLTRKFSFYTQNSEFVGKHTFYEDPFCTIPKFLVTARGQFKFTSISKVIEGSTNIDFKIERASLTLYSKRMVHEMRMFNSCGRQDWKIGDSQELSSTYGCLQLGLVIPFIQYEVVKVEMNYEGSCLLYLGQADTDNISGISSSRPTAFQDPLIKCAEGIKNSQLSRSPDLDDYDHFYNSAFHYQPFKIYIIVICIVNSYIIF